MSIFLLQLQFVYNYRIFDRYDKPVASLAVLADEHKQWKPTSYGYTVLGCKHTLEFPVAKLTDYEEKLDDLLASENAFGLITAAHILTQQTRREDEERYKAKLSLLRILYERKWDKQRVINLFAVLDWLMTLPTWMESRIRKEIETIEETNKMQYITSIERIGIAKGRVEGRVEGLQEGRVEGRVEGESKLLRRQLERRFGAIPAWATEKLSNASEETLEAWGEAILTAPTLEAVFNTDVTP